MFLDKFIVYMLYLCMQGCGGAVPPYRGVNSGGCGELTAPTDK